MKARTMLRATLATLEVWPEPTVSWYTSSSNTVVRRPKNTSTVAAVINSSPPTSIRTNRTAWPKGDQKVWVSTCVRPVTVEAEIAVKKATCGLARSPSAAKGKHSKTPPETFSRRKRPKRIAGADVHLRGGTRRRMGTRSGGTLRQRTTGVADPVSPSFCWFTTRMSEKGRSHPSIFRRRTCAEIKMSGDMQVENILSERPAALGRPALLSAQLRICQSWAVILFVIAAPLSPVLYWAAPYSVAD